MDVEKLQGDLRNVPKAYRKVMARWLLAMSEQYRPSLVLTKHEAQMIAGALTGAAVELYEPMTEDTTLLHAAEVIEELTSGLHKVG